MLLMREGDVDDDTDAEKARLLVPAVWTDRQPRVTRFHHSHLASSTESVPEWKRKPSRYFYRCNPALLSHGSVAVAYI